jgi:hypothetical protein
MLNEYPKEFADCNEAIEKKIVLLQIQYTKALSLFHILRVFPRNSDALETVSTSAPFSKLNIHSMGH